MLSSLILLLTVGIVTINGEDLSNMMAGGEPVAKGEFPWLVHISYGGSEYTSRHCGAVLIHPRVMVGSSDCFFFLSKITRDKKPIVKIGGITRDGDGAITSISPDWLGLDSNKTAKAVLDIFMVIQLSEEIKWDKSLISAASTISLPKKSPQEQTRCEECYLIGTDFTVACPEEPPCEYMPCADPKSVEEEDEDYLTYEYYHECIENGCCHYRYPNDTEICYFRPGGLCNNQGTRLSRKPCLPKRFGTYWINESECQLEGCCYDWRVNGCYLNSYKEHKGKRPIMKLAVNRVVNDTTIYVTNKKADVANRTCFSQKDGPYVCRTKGSKKWTLYGMPRTFTDCGAPADYFNIYNLKRYIYDHLDASIVEDLQRNER